MRDRYQFQWQANGIEDLIELSTLEFPFDPSLICAGLCFWNGITNTMDLPIGPTSPSVLDMATIFGLRPHEIIISCNSVSENFCQDKDIWDLRAQFEGNIANINSWGGYLKAYFTNIDENGLLSEEGHVRFLLYFVCRYLMCCSYGKPTSEWILLAEALNSVEGLAL